MSGESIVKPDIFDNEQYVYPISQDIAKTFSSPAYKDLLELLRKCYTDNKELANVIAPGIGRYSITSNTQTEFFDLLYESYKQGIKMHFAEKQNADASGLMIDLDIDHYEKTSKLTDDLISEITRLVTNVVISTIKVDASFTTHVGILKPSTPRLKNSINSSSTVGYNDSSYYREGLHLLYPGLYLSRNHKSHIMNKLRSEDVELELRNIISQYNIELASDKNIIDNTSACTVFFIGCVKTDPLKQPDVLHKIYKISIRNKGDECFICDETKAFANINICYEFSLNFIPRENIITRKRYECRELLDYKPIQQTSTNDDGELQMVLRKYPNASTHYELLLCMDQRRSSEYTYWRCILLALAKESMEYKILADIFSQRSPEKYNRFEFEKHWASSLEERDKCTITVGILYSYAKEDNPEMYTVIMRKSAIHILRRIVCDNNLLGKVEHTHVAQIICTLSGQYKYVTSIKPGFTKHTFYEMVTPDTNDAKPGQVYKYREFDDHPSSLNMYISNVLPQLYDNVIEFINKQIEKADDDKIRTFWVGRRQKLISSKSSLFTNKYKLDCISQCKHMMNNALFAYSMDRTENIMGVGNGVLVFEERGPRLISNIHNYAISRFTSVEYKDYDPNNPIIQHMESIFRNLFPDNEQDAYEFIMMYISMGLMFGSKPELFLLLHGCGSNAKSLIKDILLETFGEDFVYCCAAGMLSNGKLKEGGPNTAAMKLEFARWVFMDEFPETGISDYNMKAILGNTVSANEKYGKERSFLSKGTFLGACNVKPIITSKNYGFWRRWLSYNMKMVFTSPGALKNPYDENNPYHRKIDENIKNVLIKKKEYKEAVLSILVKWLYILQRKYNNKIRSAPKPTIDNETNLYIAEQDFIAKFVSTRIVKCVDTSVLPIEQFISCCHEFLKSECPDRKPMTDSEITIALIEESSLKDHATVDKSRSGVFIHGFRPLQKNAYPSDGEMLIRELETKSSLNISTNYVSVDYKNMTIREYLSTN